MRLEKGPTNKKMEDQIMTLIKFKNSNDSERMPFMPALLGNFFNDFMNSDLVAKDVFKTIPAVNIVETPEKFVVELAAPGMNKEDFKVEVEKEVLSIHAEKKTEKNDETNRFTRREFSYASFNRSFTMPDNVNADNVSAEYTNGILKLHLPKKEEAKQKPVKEITVS
jgi:HSP20 family protein